MLAIGRAIMTRPRLLLLDEPSTGLSPVLVAAVMQSVERLRGLGMTVVIVEQAVETLLRAADRIVVMRNGRVAADRPVDEVDHEEIREAYLGGGGPGVVGGLS
jgi:branched-chain amino acid transport system ATP-binding protein